MADLGKVEGGKQGPSPLGPKKKKDLSSDQFRELMKSGKVRETDPEEQRKRKSKSEKEEEEAAEMTAAQPPAPDQLVPRAATPFELNIKEGVGVEGVAESAAAAPEEQPAPAPPPPPPYFPPPPEEGETPEVTTPQQPRTERTERRRPVEQQKQTEPTKEATKKGKEVEKKQPTKPTHAPVAKAKPKPKTPEEEQAAEEAAPYTPPQPLAHALPVEEKKVEEPPLAKGAWEATEDLERGEEKLTKKVAPVKKEEPTLPTTFQQAAPPAAPVLLPGEPLPPISAPFANLPAPVAALFERMVGVMTVMNTTGVTQTTINLDNPRFEGSAFYGAQIIISEFSTAPKAYNIQLLGNQRAVDLFTSNAQELVAAFQAGNYTFKVNRIDTGYISAAPEERRRETRRVKRKRGAE